MSKPLAEKPSEPKPSFSISEVTYPKVKELSMDDTVVITAVGRVIDLSSNERYKDPKEKTRFNATLMLDNVKVTGVDKSRGRAKTVAKMLNIKK